jgi:hypothetical protein
LEWCRNADPPGELAGNLFQVGADHVQLGVDQRVEAEDQIDGAVVDHVEQRPSFTTNFRFGCPSNR